MKNKLKIWLLKLNNMKKALLLSTFILTISGTFWGINLYAKNTSAFWLDKNFSVNEYYYGKINDTSYWFKIEKCDNKIAEGHYFAVTDNVYADIKKFSIEKKKKNYFINLEQKSVKVRIDLKISSTKLEGEYYKTSKKFLFFDTKELLGEFNFVKYKKPEFKEFPERYKAEIFDEITVISDQVYGLAKGYWSSYITTDENYLKVIKNAVISSLTKRDLDLKMDIYMPSSDDLQKRPLIIFIHGGAFYIGDKKSETMVKMCEYFAKRGYVTASVNYRIGFKPVGPSIERAGYRALQDVHAALRYLLENSSKYKINTDFVFVGGSSAGGITALNLAFMRNKDRPESSGASFFHADLGEIESSGNDYKKACEIKAVINMWGAINNLEMLDNSKTSVISFHGDEDKIVPIDYDYPFQDIKGGFNTLILSKMYGSLPIHIQLKEKGCREKLHIFKGAGHSLNVDENDKINDNFYFICDESSDFLYNEIVLPKWKIKSSPFTPINCAMAVYETSVINNEKLYWDIEGGVIVGTNKNKVRVVWFKDAEIHKLKLSFLTDTHAAFYDEYKF